jgi:hypothetical protein
MQTLTLNLDTAIANDLIAALEVARRQDEEFKKLNPPVQPQTAE